jgi:succinate dehydrogenase / fumarate reductase, flavoprotein subunit
VKADHPAFADTERDVRERVAKLLDAKGNRSVDSYHKELGGIMWDYCGMARSAEGLKKALGMVRELRQQYWRDVRVLGAGEEPNQALEKAGRVADFFELAELMCIDALHREESCGGHFRVEYQADGEAVRNDEKFLYVAAWEHKGEGNEPVLHKEPLVYEEVKLATRSYK